MNKKNQPYNNNNNFIVSRLKKSNTTIHFLSNSKFNLIKINLQSNIFFV